MKKQPVVASDFGIRRIHVENLFGQFTYEICAEAAPLDDFPRLIILYGENGSGKTTVLKLVFDLLSPLEDRRHKTSVAATRFRRVEIEMADDLSVVAERPSPSIVGPFKCTISRRNKVLASYFFKTDDEGLITTNAREEPALAHFLQHLADLHVGLYFLADDRTIASDNFPKEPEEHERFWGGSKYVDNFLLLEAKPRSKQTTHDALKSALERVKTWATQKALRASTQGEEDVNAIYTDIIRRLAGSAHGVVASGQPTVERLLVDLQEQVKRSETFAAFGLTSVPNVGGLIELPQKAFKGPIGEAVARVLEPYVDGMRARLNALQDVQRSISAFVRTANSFYSKKSVSFDVHNGVRITASNGEAIGPKALSSGERQLLLLFCNTLVAKDQPSIFIIDEPELSLNVAWQRDLVGSLLEMTRESKVQFLLATHSIELLTRHRGQVAELREKRRDKPDVHPSKEN